MILEILLRIILPILVLVSLGALMKVKFKTDLTTLGKLNIYLFVPAFLFDRVSTSDVTGPTMVAITLATTLQVILGGLAAVILCRAFKTHRTTTAAVALGTMFFNAGNLGIPLAELAFPGNKDAIATQAFVVLSVNFLTWTVGWMIASAIGAGTNWKEALFAILKLPMIPTLILALIARWWLQQDPSNHLHPAIAAPTRYLSNGMVAIALVTLGTQLASNPRWPRWKPVIAVMFLRMVLCPAMLLAMLYLVHRFGWKQFDLWPNIAMILVVTSGVPSAVNTLLLTMEVGGDAELAADCVFWTTLFSAVSITGWIIIARGLIQ